MSSFVLDKMIVGIVSWCIFPEKCVELQIAV